MLLSSFFILDFKKSEGSLDVDLPENGFLCYRITDTLLSGSGSINKKLLSSYKKDQFCLLVNVDRMESDFEKMIEFLVPYTFFYNYLKFNYENPLLVFESETQDANKYITLARKIFKRHGYNDLDAIVLYKNPASINNSERNILFNFQKNDSNFSSEYINAIKQVGSANSFLYFLLNDSSELSGILNTIGESETMIEKQFPQTYYLLEESRIIRKKEREMLFKIGLQQEQIDSINNYHLYYNAADNRYKRQIKELISFYKDEYEILPMWYKRFGHIIKVVTGKRTFKSLFNDNVKKYKT